MDLHWLQLALYFDKPGSVSPAYTTYIIDCRAIYRRSILASTMTNEKMPRANPEWLHDNTYLYTASSLSHIHCLYVSLLFAFNHFVTTATATLATATEVFRC